MPKGYKVPKSSSPRATMKASAPKSGLLGKSPSGMPKIPATRPTWKRNQQSNPKGFKPGSY